MKQLLPIVLLPCLLASSSKPIEVLEVHSHKERQLVIQTKSVDNNLTNELRELERQRQIAEMKSNLIDAPLINQMPQLPRGCEVTSLAMLLGHAGINVDKMTLAEQIVKVPFESNGLRGHPNEGFVGNIYTFSEPGLGVYHKPINDLAKNYLGDRVVDLTGQSFDVVINQLKHNKPVWVIINVAYDRLSEAHWMTWNTNQGPINITYKEHSVLITGFDEQSIYFNDPLTGVKDRKVDKAKFISGWEQMGSQAISYN